MPRTRPTPDETVRVRIVAQDPSVRSRGRILTATVEVPAESLLPGPWGHRVQVIDYDATRGAFYKPHARFDHRGALVDAFANASDHALLTNPTFHQQNVYAIVMRTLATFERVLGRRIEWGFGAHQLKVVPHAFEDANAFYSGEDYGLFFGYFGDGKRPAYTCLSHDIVVHETTHALLDGLRKKFADPSSSDQAAFHEGFSDVVALLSIFQLPETVSELLSRAGRARSKKTIDRGFILNKTFLGRVLFALGEEMGEDDDKHGHKLPGRALRNSFTETPKRNVYAKSDHNDPHTQGEILVGAMLRAFVNVWRRRLVALTVAGPGPVDRVRVVEEGVSAAEHLLHMAIRGIDYTPPVHLTFGDFLSAMLTGDCEVQPNDSRYSYRKELRESFAAWGIAPAARPPSPGRAERAPHEAGLWCTIGNEDLRYEGIHYDALRRDRDEVFRFVWENRLPLRLKLEAYTTVRTVRPVRRIAPDGALLQETVAEYHQLWEPSQSDLRKLGVRRDANADPDDEIRGAQLHGGGTLIFDDFGRLKYHVHNAVGNIRRQRGRLAYLKDRKGPRSFADMHRMRAMAAGAPPDSGW